MSDTVSCILLMLAFLALIPALTCYRIEKKDERKRENESV